MIFGLFGGDKKRVAELISAARSGDIAKIEQLLSKGADINAPEPESGDTPILAAIDNSQWAAVELLLKHHPDLELQDKKGISPLYFVVSQGDSSLPRVMQLLEAGASPDVGPSHGDNAGATPLHIAAATGANGCLESLLRHGASATKQIPSGATPLHTAAIGGDQRTIDLLCAAGASVSALNNDKRTPLHNCGITGNAKVAAALIQQGSAVDGDDAEGWTPLMRAVMNNHVEVAKVLLDGGADPDVMVRTDVTTFFPLLVAAMNGFDEMIRILLDKGANAGVHIDGEPSLADAAKHSGNETAVKLLAAALKVHRAAAKKAQGSTKEIEALWKNIVQGISQQDQGALHKLKGSKHFSALTSDSQLLVACVLGDAELAQATLAAGADPNRRFTDLLNGITPLFATVGFAHSLGVARLLMEHGGDPNQSWDEGSTVLMETTTDQHLELAELLLNKGANVNARMKDGRTALILAARNGGAKCVDLFLDAGADINAIENEHGMGAFGCALNRLDLKLAEHLFDRGAEPNFGSIETLPLAIAEHASLDFVRALVERGCKLVREDQRGRMAFISAKNSNPEVFDYFLSHGADPSVGNDFGYTPLILAALNNRPTLIRRYLERGDDASVRDIDGETALSLALERRHNAAVDVLREIHVEEKDYSALAPDAAMLKAADDGALGTILNLRDEGFFVNAKDDDGNTPMLLAVKAGHLGVVRSLYHLGADINHRNHGGETALSIAKALDASDIVNSLQEFGALDALEGDGRKLSSLFGGIPVYNGVDTMFGRMSRPYKDKPPYDNPESESEAEPDEDVGDEGSNDCNDDLTEDGGVTASVEAKLDLLGQVLDSDQVKEQLQEAVLEQLAQKLNDWRAMHESSGLEHDELAELNRILGLFGVGGEDTDTTEEIIRTPLHEAVHAQDLSAVKKLIKGGADVNEADGEGNTVLLVAILTGEEKLVDALMKLGADPNKARLDGKGPLFGAVRTGKDKTLQMLIKAGAVVDASFSLDHNGIEVEGCTAMYAAALLGRLSACKSLLGSGAMIDAANDVGYTPLMAALEGGHEDVIDFLLKSGANADPAVVARMHVESLGGKSPLYVATRKENIAVVKKLLKRGVDVNRQAPNGWTPLKSAAQQGNLDIVKVLLDAGADPNIADDTNYTPLMNAVSGEHEDIVKLLLKFHADPNVQSGDNPEDDDWEPGRTALMDAAVSGNVSIARELLKQGANPNLLNSKGRTALHSAVFSASTDMVSLLLKAGADINVYDQGNGSERLSPLDTALGRWAGADKDERQGGIFDVLELMLQKGIPDDRTSLNETALDLVTNGHLDVAEFLRKHGVKVDPNQLMNNGASRLFIMAAVGDEGLEAAELLLRIGANPNYKSPAGLPVLSLAVRNGATNLVKALLAAGADVMARNRAEALAYDLAAIYDHQDLARLLIDQMNCKVPESDKQDSEGNTSLMLAVKKADASKVSHLVANGANTGRRDLHGDSPLSYAVCHEMDEIVQLLRNVGAERIAIDASGGVVSIVTAANSGALGTVLDLLDTGASIDTSDSVGETALTAAEVHPGLIKVLAKMGADLSHRNHKGKTAYMIAIASHRTLVMQALEQVGSPMEELDELDGFAQVQAMVSKLKAEGPSGESTSDGDESKSSDEAGPNGEELVMAAVMGDAITVCHLIAAGVDVNYENDEGRTALAMAISGPMQGNVSRRGERNFEQIIDSLLVAGADPKVGQFPYLVFAAMSKRLHLVNALIRAGADVNRTIGEGKTALFMSLLAPDAGQPVDDRCAVALLKSGADASLRHESGAMPIHLAAGSNYLGALQALLDRRPQDVDAKTNIGITPLMMAATESHPDAVKLLLKFGADSGIKDQEGLTAKEVAIKNGNDEVVQMLS